MLVGQSTITSSDRLLRCLLQDCFPATGFFGSAPAPLYTGSPGVFGATMRANEQVWTAGQK